MVITSKHSKTQCFGTGEGVEKRFFFYGIELERSHISGRNVELAVTIETNTANPIFTRRNFASVAAGKTAHPFGR